MASVLKKRGPRIQISESSFLPAEYQMLEMGEQYPSPTLTPIHTFHTGIFTEGEESIVPKTRARNVDECSEWSDKDTSSLHNRSEPDYGADHDDYSVSSTEPEHIRVKQFEAQKTMLKLRSQFAVKKTILEKKSINDMTRPYTQKIMLELRKSSDRDSDSGCHSSVTSECSSPDKIFEPREPRKIMLQLKPRTFEDKKKVELIRNEASSDSDDNKENVKTPIDYYAPPTEDGKIGKTQLEYSKHIAQKKALVNGLAKIKIPNQQEMRVRYGGHSGSPRSPHLPISPCSPAALARMKRKGSRVSVCRGEGDEEHIDFIAAGIVEFALAESPRCWERSFFK